MNIVSNKKITADIKPFFSSAVEFSQYIETKANAEHATVLETLVTFIEEYEIEPEKIKNFISDSLKNKLKMEYIDLGMLRQEKTLTDFFEG